MALAIRETESELLLSMLVADSKRISRSGIAQHKDQIMAEPLGITWVVSSGKVNTNSWLFTSTFGPFYMGPGATQYEMNIPGAWLIGSLAFFAMIFVPLIMLELWERK